MPESLSESLVVVAEPAPPAVGESADDAVAATPAVGGESAESVVAAAVTAVAAATPAPAPRVVLRLGFNKVLYDTDLHPHGFVPEPGQVAGPSTAQGRPKGARMSIQKQIGLAAVISVLFLFVTMQGMRAVMEHDDPEGDDRFRLADHDETVDPNAERPCYGPGHGSVSIGGQGIPSSDSEVREAIGLSAWPGGVPGAGKPKDSLPEACPASRDCCAGDELCCPAGRPRCLHHGHCCAEEASYCPVDGGTVQHVQAPAGSKPTRTLGSACCDGECITIATGEPGSPTEHFCCTEPSCMGYERAQLLRSVGKMLLGLGLCGGGVCAAAVMVQRRRRKQLALAASHGVELEAVPA